MAFAIDDQPAFPRRRNGPTATLAGPRGGERDRERRLKAQMLAAQRGDGEAYQQLLRELRPEIERLVRRRIFDPSASEDVTQNCLMAIHRGRHSFRPDRPFLAWMRCIVRNTTFDHLRRVRRRSQVEQPGDPAKTPEPAAGEDPCARLEASSLLTQMLDALPRDQREAIEMVKVLGLTGEEAARRVGISAGALRLRVYRGCRALRKQFGECVGA